MGWSRGLRGGVEETGTGRGRKLEETVGREELRNPMDVVPPTVDCKMHGRLQHPLEAAQCAFLLQNEDAVWSRGGDSIRLSPAASGYPVASTNCRKEGYCSASGGCCITCCKMQQLLVPCILGVLAPRCKPTVARLVHSRTPPSLLHTSTLRPPTTTPPPFVAVHHPSAAYHHPVASFPRRTDGGGP
jgi:hypothetical protein